MPKDRETELFYHVDDTDKPLGSITRKEAHNNKEFIHRSVYIVIRNSQNQLLFQKRSPNKDTYPNHWALGVAGHVTFRESYEESAVREVEEELGKKVKVNFIVSTLLKLPEETEFCSIFEAEKLEAKSFNYDRDEISELGWIDPKELEMFTHKNPVTPDTLMILTKLGYI